MHRIQAQPSQDIADGGPSAHYMYGDSNGEAEQTGDEDRMATGADRLRAVTADLPRDAQSGDEIEWCNVGDGERCLFPTINQSWTARRGR